MTTTVNFDATYSVANYPGIAWNLSSWKKVWVPVTYMVVDEDDELVEVYEDDGEWLEDESSGFVMAYMVGDNRLFEIDVDDLIEIQEDGYCHECGQIGCNW